jgi:hypothetical protein
VAFVVITCDKDVLTPMRELPTEIPDVALLLALEPEELGAKLLFLMRRRNEDQVNLQNFFNELWHGHNSHQPRYPSEKQYEVDLALLEAWKWLDAQGLLIPSPRSSTQSDWRILSR